MAKRLTNRQIEEQVADEIRRDTMRAYRQARYANAKNTMGSFIKALAEATDECLANDIPLEDPKHEKLQVKAWEKWAAKYVEKIPKKPENV